MNIVLGITGSIAAYKSADLISRLRKCGHEVKVILTKNGSEFITALTLETLSKNPVVTDMFCRNYTYEVEHISLAKWADVFVVAPASANFLAKYAVGIADDMLTTTILATKATVVIAPAMNTAMYEHITTQTNMQTLKSRGAIFIEPESGMLACGDTGKGRMAEPQDICKFLCNINTEKNLAGKTILVTAGATAEDIDPVRYITNRSTGKMGVSIANSAVRRGACVYLVKGENVNIKTDSRVNVVTVRSSSDMCKEVNRLAPQCDIVISAAAPADFTPQTTSDIKIKKNGESGLTLNLVPTTDILKSISVQKGKRIHIGFAAETNDIEANARKKLESKNLDAIAANDVSGKSGGFGSGKSSLTLYLKNGDAECSGFIEKEELANWLLNHVAKIYDNNQR